MKNQFLITFALFLSLNLTVYPQNIGINSDGSALDGSAMLDSPLYQLVQSQVLQPDFVTI
ncbi:MAG: hypothetical protein NTU44_05215 [Bacteroidetes bacterium]|nr:hypothetical protein [Bacteroidota bacterium]